MDHRDLPHRHVEELERRSARARAAKELIEHALACPYSFAECGHARERIAARIPAVFESRPDRAAHSRDDVGDI